MRLEIGKCYRNGLGSKYTIGGRCRFHPQFVWTHEGDWFDPETGRYVTFIRDGVYEPMPPSWRVLVEEVVDDHQ